MHRCGKSFHSRGTGEGDTGDFPLRHQLLDCAAVLACIHRVVKGDVSVGDALLPQRIGQFRRANLCPRQQHPLARLHLCGQRLGQILCVVPLRHQVGEDAVPFQLFCGARPDGSKAQMGKGAQVAAIFLQAVKENAHPGDAGEGRPLIVADVGDCLFQLWIFLVWLQADGRQLDHLRAQLVKPVRHAGDKLLRPCQNHPNPIQRTVLRPAQRLFQRAHLADNQHRRRLDVGFARLLRQVGDGGNHPALYRAGALLQNRRRHLRVHPRLHQPFADHLH